VTRAAESALDDLDMGDAAPWCSGGNRPACGQAALELALRVQRLAPDKCSGYALHSRARMATGDSEGALRELADAADHVADRVVCLKQLVDVAVSAKDEDAVKQATNKIVNAGCIDEDECARNVAWVGDMEQKRGNVQRAVILYRKAFERAPGDEAALRSLAVLAAQAGLHAEAAQAYERLSQLHPANAGWRRSAELERDRALRGMEER
jgi:tetratricopeptide (TPR) repeat protein